jgi:vacuolar protein sorting-associated protein 13A/C
MSFSSLVADIASKFLGDYIDGFNAQNMEISLISGSAVMRNLKLKKTILDKFDLPVKITSSILCN